ncbi:Transthyretin-like family protein [Onchocerca flexuosa]|uniref:Transthyretin-like family protein n=2 Tax=Onchocerca flexuosa TaxID=387005 RepID=A0A238C3Y3_9BILA|nr:Transthyretin-like family protein [Onchocerca flexuosa]
MFTGCFISLILSFAFVIDVDAMRKQGVAVRGQFLCGSAPANQTKVRIVDTDTGPDPDDVLDENTTDSDGKFELNGSTRELTDIDPVLYVWTDCNDGLTPCQRKITFKIPKKFIHSGVPKPEQWIDIGVLNLQGYFEEEEREC